MELSKPRDVPTPSVRTSSTIVPSLSDLSIEDEPVDDDVTGQSLKFTVKIKILLLSKIFVFVEKFYFCRNILYLAKIFIFGENFHFWRKF